MNRLFKALTIPVILVVFFTVTAFATTSKLGTGASTNEKEVKLSKFEKEKMDTYFSNFSELSMDRFAESKIKNEALLMFGIYHNWVNNDKVFKIQGDNSTIGEKYVLDAIYKYFGKKPNFSKAVKAKYGYQAGVYKIESASGEAFRFSQLDKMYSIGNDNYICYVSTYVASSGFTGNVHSPLSLLLKNKAEGEEVGKRDNIIAKVKKVISNGKARYILLSYENRR